MKNILIFITLLVIVSCDGPYKNCPEYYFSDNFKSYTMFTEGSYWIYEDTANQQVDSMNLISQSISFIDYCDYNTESQQVLEQQYSSTFFDANQEGIKISGYAATREYNQEHFPPVGYFIDNSDIIGETNYIDSILINNVWYKEIRTFKSDKYEFYWAKNIGLIKKVITYPWNSDSVYSFELIKYQIKEGS